jgi:S-layer homology domain
MQREIIGNADKFRPEDPLTRAEFLKIVGNSAGWNTLSASGVTIPFTDVSSSMWYTNYVRYALSANIIRSGSTFRPNEPISRGEVAKILALTLGTPISEYKGVFADVPKSYSLAFYIEALKQAKIFDGQATENGLIFRPADNITRAEIAKVVVRTFNF